MLCDFDALDAASVLRVMLRAVDTVVVHVERIKEQIRVVSMRLDCRERLWYFFAVVVLFVCLGSILTVAPYTKVTTFKTLRHC